MNTEPVLPLLMFLMTGLVVLIIAVALVHLRNARDLLEEEQRRTRDECNAFDELARRVTALDGSSATVTVGPHRDVGPLISSTADGQLDRVMDAYRETVMSVPHYEEEYDESLRVNMAAELSEEVAAAVTEGDALTPQVKAAIVNQARTARTEREEYLDVLELEAKDLLEKERSLAEIDESLSDFEIQSLQRRSFSQLLDAWETLDETETRLQELLGDRQESLRELRRRMNQPSPLFQGYLYEPLPVTYPVLSVGTSLLERLDHARDLVATSVSRRS